MKISEVSARFLKRAVDKEVVDLGLVFGLEFFAFGEVDARCGWLGRWRVGEPSVDLFPLGDGKSSADADQQQEKDPKEGSTFGIGFKDDAFDAGFIAGEVTKGRIGSDL